MYLFCAHTSRRLAAALIATCLVLGFCPVLAASAAPGDSADPGPSGVSWLVQPAGPQGGADARSYLIHGVNPGESVEDAISITNTSEAELTLRVSGADAFTSSDSGVFGLRPTDERPQAVGSWVQLPVAEITIPARSRADVPVLISVPVDAAPGDHTGGIVTTYTSQVTDEHGQPVLLETRIAVRVYLSVAGERLPRLSVQDLSSSFELSPDLLTGTLRLAYSVQNTGNVRLGVEEEAEVTALWGAVLADAVTSDLEELLPGSSVSREIVVDGLPAVLALRTALTVEPIDLTGDGRGLTALTERTSAIAVPWVVLVLAALVVAGTMLILRQRRRRWRSLHAEVAAARASSARPGEEPLSGLDSNVASPLRNPVDPIGPGTFGRTPTPERPAARRRPGAGLTRGM